MELSADADADERSPSLVGGIRQGERQVRCLLVAEHTPAVRRRQVGGYPAPVGAPPVEAGDVFGMMAFVATRLSRWHGIFAAALQTRPAVGFQVALTEHLGRIPSHAEAVAARRAAHSFAAAGRGRLERVPSIEHGSPHRLVLVRTDVEATPDELVAALSPTGTSVVSPTAQATHTNAARRLVDTVREASAQARHVETGHLSSTERAVLEADLRAALVDLTKFRRRLTRSPQPNSRKRT